MSRLEQLLAELCPDGVEYKRLGSCIKKISNVKWEDETNCFQYIDLTSVDRDTHIIQDTTQINRDTAPSRAKQIVQYGDILFGTTRPLLNRYCQIPKEYNNQICSTGFCVLRPDTSIIARRWIYHIISSIDFMVYVEKNQQGASYPAISDTDIKKYKIPIPPLPVQEEIVRILDTFAELTAELTKRKQQYQYFRDKLLSFEAIDSAPRERERGKRGTVDDAR